MTNISLSNELKIKSTIDTQYQPAILWIKKYLNNVLKTNDFEEVIICLERDSLDKSFYKTIVFSKNQNQDNLTFIYLERLVKTLLWLKGGHKLQFAGPEYLGKFLQEIFSKMGTRSFDALFMKKIYEKDFTVEIVKKEEIKIIPEPSKPIGRNLDGYRIGFDAGGSDRKVSAVVNGKSI